MHRRNCGNWGLKYPKSSDMAELEIKVHAVDQLIDLGKGVIEKVILPPFEEVGLLLADRMKLFRLRNQVDILVRADKFLKQKNIKTKKVSTKVMASLLEDCSLEEDEPMKERWAALLVNTVRDDGNIENPLFSSILSQLSAMDAQIMDIIFRDSVSQSGSGLSKSWMHTHKMFFTSEIIKQFSSGTLSIDNLLRLRLLKEQGNNETPIVSLTNLGFSFVISCTAPD